MILRICCNSSLMYLRIKSAVVGTIIMGRFAPKGLASWPDNSFPALRRGGKKSGRTTEECFLQRQLRPWIKVILALISFKNTFSNGLANPLGIKKLKL